MIPAAMTAAPRSGSVQERCLRSVSATGFRDVTIYCEPGTSLPAWVRDTFPTVAHDERLGQWRNWLFALEATLTTRPRAKLVCTLEDDVVFCRGVAGLLDGMAWPGERCGCLQLYTSAFYDGYPVGRRSRLADEHALDLLGACALVFSRAAAECLVDWGKSRGWRGHVYEAVASAQTDPAQKEGADTYVGEVLTFSGFEIWLHNPSLAEHIGDESTLGHEGSMPRRRGLNFPGEAADATVLFSEEAACAS